MKEISQQIWKIFVEFTNVIMLWPFGDEYPLVKWLALWFCDPPVSDLNPFWDGKGYKL